LPDPAQPVTVLDLGSSEGRNAIRVMARIVATLRRRTNQPLQTIFSDLTTNNFNGLFANLEEARRASLHLGVSTVARFRTDKPQPTQPLPGVSVSPSRVVTANRPNHVWHVDSGSLYR